MSAFEFTFGLVSLLLGLGFAHIAESFAKLVMAGKQVRWDWLSPLAAVTTFQSGLIYWWYQWSLRDQEVTLGGLVVRAIACLTLYVMAVAAFPAPREGPIDLKEHYQTARRLFFGAYAIYILIVGILNRFIRDVFFEERVWQVPWLNLLNVTILIACVLTKKRWFHSAALSWILIDAARRWLPQAISG
jgi:hypothetical protein